MTRLETLIQRQHEANERKAIRKKEARRIRVRNWARARAKKRREAIRIAAAQLKAQRRAERAARRAAKQAARDKRAATKKQLPVYVQKFIAAFEDGRRVGFEEGKLFAQQQRSVTQASPALIKL